MPRVTDWTGRYTGEVIDTVRPRSVPEVAAALRSGFAVTTRGGNTGLVGGSVPATRRPTILLDTGHLNVIGGIDHDAGQVAVGTGVTLAALQRHVAGSGWVFGVDLAARDSATIGGMAATNAGGVRVIRYGMMRSQVMGVQAVLPNGRVIDETAVLTKNNTGYSLSCLAVGSEGTLVVITAVRLRLHPQPRASSLAALPIGTLREGLQLVGAIRRSGAELLAAETVDATCWRLMGGIADLPASPWYLLVEVADGGGADGLRELPSKQLIVATSPTEQRRLWRVREGLAEAWGSRAGGAGTVVQKFDVSLPPGELDAFAAAARRLVPVIGIFGHLADGNLHLEVIDPDREWDAEVLGLVSRHHGSISAEHGIGQAKRAYLGLVRPAVEVAAMRAIKAALDPEDVMNPGVIFPERPDDP